MPTKVNKTGNSDIDGVLWGSKWSPNANGQYNLTYSIPTAADWFAGEYQYDVFGFEAMSAAQTAAIHSIIKKFAAVCGLNITQTTTTGAGNLRFGEADQIDYDGFFGPQQPKKPGNGTAEGNVPSDEFPAVAQGDMWFSKGLYENPRAGNYAYTAGFMHELGHALGLKHGHSAQGGFPSLPSNHDTQEYSIMTYRRYVGDTPGQQPTFEQSEFPTTPMQSDIAALQHMYGADYGYRNTNTTYKWSAATSEMFVNGVGQGQPQKNYVFLTVWDGGGRDTYDFSNYAVNLRINLQAGESTTLKFSQRADLDGNAGTHVARGSIYNALLHKGDTRSLIENAIGGSGDDVIAGNVKFNVLKGSGGGDILVGLGGRDSLFGGLGNDRLDGGLGRDVCWGGSGRDVFDFDSFRDSAATASGRDHINGFNRADDRIDLSGIDADTDSNSGNDGFRFIGQAGFSGADGQLRYWKVNPAGMANDKTIIAGDVNGATEGGRFHIELDGLYNLTRDDFVL